MGADREVGRLAGAADREDARRRVAGWRPQVAVIYGSGLWATPRGVRVEDEVPYDALGWPATAVPGHPNVLRLGRAPAGEGRELGLALACGRPHRYEGWTDAQLERPVTDLAAAGASCLVLTNSCGALRPTVAVGGVVACSGVVDLQRRPAGETPERLKVCDEAAAKRVALAAGAAAPSSTGSYVAVCGPQFETLAEVSWLAQMGDVVGMSAAPEVRAAAAAGVECCLLALVANAAADVTSHEEVLVAGGHLATLVAEALARIVVARWPDLLLTH